MVESLVDYLQRPRVEWVTHWPAMTVLGVSATHWTSSTETAIVGKSLTPWYNENVAQLDALTDMVRGKLPGQVRIGPLPNPDTVCTYKTDTFLSPSQKIVRKAKLTKIAFNPKVNPITVIV